MTRQEARLQRIQELWTRLFEEAKQDSRASIPQYRWNKIIAKFKLDTGLSDRTIYDYLITLKSMSAYKTNWDYVSELVLTSKEFERRFQFFINLGFRFPQESLHSKHKTEEK